MSDDRRPSVEDRLEALEREVERLRQAPGAPTRPIDGPDIGAAMQLVYPLAWLTDKLAWLFSKRWRDISRGNPR